MYEQYERRIMRIEQEYKCPKFAKDLLSSSFFSFACAAALALVGQPVPDKGAYTLFMFGLVFALNFLLCLAYKDSKYDRSKFLEMFMIVWTFTAIVIFEVLRMCIELGVYVFTNYIITFLM